MQLDNICAAFIYRKMSEIDITVKKISKEGNILTLQLGQIHVAFSSCSHSTFWKYVFRLLYVLCFLKFVFSLSNWR